MILFYVLEHMPIETQIDFMRALYGALRPGGRVLLTVPNAASILAAVWRYTDYTHHCSFTDHSLYFVLRNGGFDPIDIDSSKDFRRPSFRLWRRSNWEPFRKWLVRWCWLHVIKAEMRPEDAACVNLDQNLKVVAYKRS